jgi:hypothetical protein
MGKWAITILKSVLICAIIFPDSSVFSNWVYFLMDQYSVGLFGMTDPFWGKIINLMAISLTLLAGGLARIFFLKPTLPNYFMLIVVVLPWLGIGALMRNGTHTYYTRTKLLGFKDIFAAVLLGWGLMGLFWLLPDCFPSLGSNLDGIWINLSRSPIVLLIGMAFLLGFFSQASVKIFPTARKIMWVSLIEFFKGESDNSLKHHLRGINGILFLSIPAQSNRVSDGT